MPSIGAFSPGGFEIKGNMIKIGEKYFVVRSRNHRITDKGQLEKVIRLLQNNFNANQIEHEVRSHKKTKMVLTKVKGLELEHGIFSKTLKSNKELPIEKGARITLTEPPTKYRSKLDALIARIDLYMVNIFIFLDWATKPFEKPILWLDGKQVYKAYFNYSWKSKSPIEGEKAIAKRYKGQPQRVAIKRGLEMVREFQKQKGERGASVQTIVDHRRILNEMSKKMERSTIGSSAKAIQKRIDALSDPDSDKVVHVESKGYSSFSIPGGYVGHAVTYEFQRDSDGCYFFVIHNRGSGVELDEIHGDIITVDGIRYARTSAKIEVTKEQLTDSNFLEELLVQDHIASDMKGPYNVIKKYLSVGDPPELKIVKSDLEKQYLLTHSLEDARRLVAFDPAYHTIQVFGTCTESSLTGAEKAMAEPQVRRELKLFTIDSLAQQVAKKRPLVAKTRKDKQSMLQHHIFKKRKIMRSQ